MIVDELDSRDAMPDAVGDAAAVQLDLQHLGHPTSVAAGSPVCELGAVEEALTLAGAIVIGIPLIWLAFRIEPHWSRRDGTRFTCRVQPLTHDLASEGTWREMRATIVDRRLVLSSRGLRAVRLGGTYAVVARSPSPPRKRAVFLVRSETVQMALRVPASSPSVAALDAIAEQAP